MGHTSLGHPSLLRAVANRLQPAPNSHSRSIYAGKPNIPPAAPREALIDWLEWCDPNGCYSDSENVHEWGAPMTIDDCWACVASLLGDDAAEYWEAV